jgi:hypothetical protein
MLLQTDIQRALGHFFSALADFALSWFATKFKIHVMAHIADCVDWFLLLKLYYKEPFELHNTPMQNSLVYSNCHAASQHIGICMNRPNRSNISYVVASTFQNLPILACLVGYGLHLLF